MERIPLCRLMPGEKGRVETVALSGGMARRLAELGLIPGTAVACVMRAPFGSPAAYEVRGSVIAIRGRDAEKITVGRVTP